MRRLLSIVLLATLTGVVGAGEVMRPPSVQTIDANEAIHVIADSLAEATSQTEQRLARLGFEEQLKRLSSLDGDVVGARFSPDSLVRTLVRRTADQQNANLLLKKLYDSLKEESAALAEASALKAFRDENYKGLDPKSEVKFARDAKGESAPRLSPSAEAAVELIADHLGGEGIARLRVAILQNLNKQTFDIGQFERILLESNSRSEALARIVDAGTPPPSPEKALLHILHEARLESAAIGLDKQMIETIDRLSADLPEPHKTYRDVENQLPSRSQQRKIADKLGLPSRFPSVREADYGFDDRVSNPPSDRFGYGDGDPDAGTAPVRSPGNRPGGPGGNGNKPRRSVSEESSRSSDPTSQNNAGTKNGTASKNGTRFRNYSRNTFQPREPGGGGGGGVGGVRRTARTYRSAIRSARAARGVAVGAKVTSRVPGVPKQSVWCHNERDDRFGRLFIRVNTEDSEKTLVSRVFFADSFKCALRVLSGGYGEESDLRTGEILVLMSMDPNASWITTPLDIVMKEVMKEATNAEKRVLTNPRGDPRRRLEVVDDILRRRPALKLQFIQALSLRGVVLHPAIAGSELAWSAVRVDFAFRDIGRLLDEARSLSRSEFGEKFRNVSIKGAETWQFFERDLEIHEGQPFSVGSIQSLEVRPVRTAANSKQKCFGVSIFKFDKDSDDEVEDGATRLIELERKVEPMIDWLAGSHHDFIRLNDFSEALAILRWLGEAQSELIVLDLNGPDRPLPTPDRITSDGPSVSFEN